MKKGDMQPLHQLLFWFIIKNIIPHAQGRNQADAMDQCLTDLMDRGGADQPTCFHDQPYYADRHNTQSA